MFSSDLNKRWNDDIQHQPESGPAVNNEYFLYGSRNVLSGIVEMISIFMKISPGQNQTRTGDWTGLDPKVNTVTQSNDKIRMISLVMIWMQHCKRKYFKIVIISYYRNHACCQYLLRWSFIGAILE